MASVARGSDRGRKRNTRMDQNVGRASAVILPLIQWGVLGYVTWVVVYLICVKYLIDPSAEYRQSLGVPPRRATGIAIIVVDAVLMLLVFVPWIRLLEIIWTKQDYLPVGDKSRSKAETSTSAFDKYDASICDYEGLPLWCNECHHFKPDRTHHCKELGKCVRRMDHFCPWAGGIVAESGHKHFVQFTFFGFLYTSFVWIFIAVFLHDHKSRVGSVPGTWIGALAVAAFFSLFSGGIFFTTSYNLMINYTSVESIQRGGVQNIAFLVSRSSAQTPLPAPLSSSQKKLMNSESDVETLESSEKSTARDSIPSTVKTPVRQSEPSPNLPHAPKPSEHHGSDSDNWSVLGTVYRGSKRDRPFVVIQTKPFQHPWYIGLMMGWKDTMGTSILDWFSPFKQSPCKVRTRRGEYRWGVVVFDMAREFEAQHPGVQLAILEGQR